MASEGGKPSWHTQLADFHQHLLKSNRVLALCGAGLSASSGLPTFRGAGGLWRTHVSTSLATPQAFARDPGLVWQFYSYRRHMALSVDPNPAHYALAELARKMPGFLTLTQNVDGLSQRVDHPKDKLLLLHGTLFEVKCSNKRCGYKETNFTDPIVSALEMPTDGQNPTSNEARNAVEKELQPKSSGHELDIEKIHLPSLAKEDLPTCPKCKTSLLRPGVVWFGEALPGDVLNKAENYMDSPQNIDLIMVIGTSAQVYPAAGYIKSARRKGAKVCVVNMDKTHSPNEGWGRDDWLFQGDAAQIVPELLKPIIGEESRWTKIEL